MRPPFLPPPLDDLEEAVTKALGDGHSALLLPMRKNIADEGGENCITMAASPSSVLRQAEHAVRERQEEKMVEILILLMITLALMSSTVQSTSKDVTFNLPSNCPKTCGNISIEYPFGIGHGCFRAAGFNLTCINNHTTNSPPRLLLGDGTFEVRKIDVEQGAVFIESPKATLGANEESVNTLAIDMTRWPYSSNLLITYNIDYYFTLAENKWHVVGCSAIAILVNPLTNSTVDTCLTMCSENTDSSTQYCTLDPYSRDVLNQTSLAVQLSRLNETSLHLINTSNITAVMYDTNNVTDEALQGIIKGNTTGVMATLAWYINDDDIPTTSTCEEATKNKTTYACRSPKSDCYDAFPDYYMNYTVGYLCRCSLSYHGNPYVPDGCQDTTFTPYDPAKHCPTSCGSINVSYPFGLKQGCYRNKLFALTCNETTDPPVLQYETDYENFVVNNISLEQGRVELNHTENPDYDFADKSTPFTFLKEQTIYVWVIEYQTCEEAKKNSTTFACVAEHSSCRNESITRNKQEFLGYRCECMEGYEGSPYFLNGCKEKEYTCIPHKNRKIQVRRKIGVSLNQQRWRALRLAGPWFLARSSPVVSPSPTLRSPRPHRGLARVVPLLRCFTSDCLLPRRWHVLPPTFERSLPQFPLSATWFPLFVSTAVASTILGQGIRRVTVLAIGFVSFARGKAIPVDVAPIIAGILPLIFLELHLLLWSVLVLPSLNRGLAVNLLAAGISAFGFVLWGQLFKVLSSLKNADARQLRVELELSGDASTNLVG
ncbi:wall-associated receptor kinase 3-like [Canna indica]|uniref:Wall-associated receptor kinase 3-like n=1 Tax=Canna indica TaxID=4628 RepID=A0AAQ3JZ74_9LILI|nr:wall-associated receptor kinase 3-like [Canna indica]